MTGSPMAPKRPTEPLPPGDGGQYVYRDKKLGDTEAITLTTAPDVFQPTSTTVVLLRAARRALVPPPRSVLDLGCGCGVVAVVMAKLLPSTAAVYASDLSAAAVRLTKLNAQRNGLTVDCRQGDLFEPWRGSRFDLIIEDVAGVAEPVARLSGWYPAPVPSDAGRDGTRWILEILDRTPEHLAPGGRLYFPVLSLSREDRIVAQARARFATVTQVEEQWYPLNDQLAGQFPLLEELVAEGSIHLEQRGSRWCWATKIYLAQAATTAPPAGD